MLGIFSINDKAYSNTDCYSVVLNFSTTEIICIQYSLISRSVNTQAYSRCCCQDRWDTKQARPKFIESCDIVDLSLVWSLASQIFDFAYIYMIYMLENQLFLLP